MSCWFDALRTQKTDLDCPKCGRHLQVYCEYQSAPYFIGFITHDVKVFVDNQIVLQDVDQMYRVCGIVYHKDDDTGKHFVCRFIDKAGGVWFHNGVKYKDQVVYYDNIVNFSPNNAAAA